MWNPSQGMASGQPQSAPPSYDMVLSTPSHGQPPYAPPSYNECQPRLSPYGQNHSAPPSYNYLPYTTPGQGYSVPAESNLGSYSPRTSSYPLANGGQNMQENQELCDCRDSRRHHGILGHLLHGDHEPHEHHRHHRHHHHHDHHHHHKHHGLVALIKHLGHDD